MTDLNMTSVKQCDTAVDFGGKSECAITAYAAC